MWLNGPGPNFYTNTKLICFIHINYLTKTAMSLQVLGGERPGGGERSSLHNSQTHTANTSF